LGTTDDPVIDRAKREENEALNFIGHLAEDQKLELDEDIFKRKWKDFKQNTGNKYKFDIQFITQPIAKQSQLVRRPKILCIHL